MKKIKIVVLASENAEHVWNVCRILNLKNVYTLQDANAIIIKNECDGIIGDFSRCHKPYALYDPVFLQMLVENNIPIVFLSSRGNYWSVEDQYKRALKELEEK